MRVLVTGSTGFIGSHLARELLNRGHEVSCLVRDPSSPRWLEGLDVTLTKGDCSDGESLRQAVRGVDYVFHLAGITKARNARDFYKVNSMGTENLLTAIEEERPQLKGFLLLSSLSAAGPSANGRPVNEETPPNPVSHYGKSKLMGEKAAMSRAERLPVLILRPPAVYGPRDRDFCLLFRMLKRGVFPYWGESLYSLLYVDDLVAGIIRAAGSPQAAMGKTYFLSDGNTYSNYDIARAIAEVVSTRHQKPIKLWIPKFAMPIVAGISGLAGGEAGIINRDKLRELGYRNWCCDSGLARRELGFSPRTTLKEGIKWTADWYKIHQWI